MAFAAHFPYSPRRLAGLSAAVVAALLCGLSACTLRGKSTASKIPPAPKPAAVAQTPQPPPPPISTPQTEIQLPPPQPVSTEALATIQPPPAPKPPQPEPEPAAKPVTRRSPAPPKPEPAAPAETPAAQAPAVPPPPEEPSRLQPVYSEDERRRVLAEIARRRSEIEGTLRTVNQGRVSAAQKSIIESIGSLLDISDDAAKRGDYRSADSLSQRALILARELTGGR